MPDEMTESQRAFSIEEFKELRKEVDQRIAATSTIFNTSVVWIAVIYAWLAKDGFVWLNDVVPPSWGYIVGLLGPIMISCWGAIRIFENEHKVMMIGNYLRVVEDRFGVDGWEHRPGDRKLWQGFVVTLGLPVLTIALEVAAILYRLYGQQVRICL
jgi:hypothetical protein